MKKIDKQMRGDYFSINPIDLIQKRRDQTRWQKQEEQDKQGPGCRLWSKDKSCFEDDRNLATIRREARFDAQKIIKIRCPNKKNLNNGNKDSDDQVRLLMHTGSVEYKKGEEIASAWESVCVHSGKKILN